MKASPCGARPPSGNPKRKFKNKHGTSTSPDNAFYNVEGEAVMRKHTPEEMVFLNKNIAVAHSQMQRQEDLNYQSWLNSNTSFCQDDELYRKETRPGRDPNVPVNKVLICTLLPERVVNEQLLPADEWGSHKSTAREYRERMQRSERQREANLRDTGKPVYMIGPKYPPEWDASKMSNCKPVKGYEDRARPPSVVEMVGPHSDFILEFLAESREGPQSERLVKISKPRKVARAILPPQSLGDLSEYGTPANEERPRRQPEVSKSLATTHEPDPKRYRARKGVSLETSPRNGDEARYLSWQKAPEAMRLAMYHDRYNYHLPSLKSEQDFDHRCPEVENTNEGRYEATWHMSDEFRLSHWLATHQSRHAPRLLKPLKMSWCDSPATRRKRLLLHRWNSGAIPWEQLARVKEDLRELDVIIKGLSTPKQDNSTGQYPVLVEGFSILDWTRQEKMILMSYGSLFVTPFSRKVSEAIRKPLLPMSEIEYSNITRGIFTDLPKFNYSWLKPFYSPFASEFAKESFERIRQQNKWSEERRVEGALGDVIDCELDEDTNVFVPSTN